MKYLLLTLLLSAIQAEAETSPKAKVAEAAYQEEIQEAAKRRFYPGGRDEADLKVQVQLTNPNRKVAPQIEDTSEPTSDD